MNTPEPKTESVVNVIELLDRLKIVYGLHRDGELAEFLGISRSGLSTWKKRNSPDYDLIFSICLTRSTPKNEHVNLHWVIAGVGPRTLDVNDMPAFVPSTRSLHIAMSSPINCTAEELKVLIDKISSVLPNRTIWATSLNNGIMVFIGEK